jgi:preprotein translocase subunit SecD
MATDFNPPSKFHHKQQVKITSGFHKGKSGKVIDCTFYREGHKTYSMLTDKNIGEPTYIIKVGALFWSRELIVMESQIEATGRINCVGWQ